MTLIFNAHLEAEILSVWRPSTTWSFKLGVMSGLVWELRHLLCIKTQVRTGSSLYKRLPPSHWQSTDSKVAIWNLGPFDKTKICLLNFFHNFFSCLSFFFFFKLIASFPFLFWALSLLTWNNGFLCQPYPFVNLDSRRSYVPSQYFWQRCERVAGRIWIIRRWTRWTRPRNS